MGAGRTWASQGNEAPGGKVGFGDKAPISSYVSLCMISSVVVMRRPDCSSIMTERSVRSVVATLPSAVVRRIDLCATLSRILYKHAKNVFAVFEAGEVAGVSDEKVGCPPEARKATRYGL